MPEPLHIPSGSTREWDILGDRVRCLLGGEQTGGAFALFHLTTPPGLGPPMHLHTREDETFHILEGEYEFVIEGRPITARPGDTLIAPRHTPHRFTNSSRHDSRMLVQVTPAGFEHFFAAVADQIGTRVPPDMAILGGLFEKAGLRMA